MDAFYQELFKRLVLVLLPEVFHRVGCSLRKDSLGLDFVPEGWSTCLDVLLICDGLIELDAFHYGILLLFGNVKFAGLIINVLSQKVRIRGNALSAFNACIDPLWRIDITPVELVEARPDSIRLDLIGKTLVLVNNKATVLYDLICDFLVLQAWRNIESYLDKAWVTYSSESCRPEAAATWISDSQPLAEA